MIENNSQKQSAGDGSTNVQAQNIYISGVTASEARQIALDVYNANIEKFSSQAAEQAVARAKSLTESFIDSVCNENPRLLEELNSPGMQLALLNAQRETARAGEKSTEELLVGLLVERSAETRRTLRQIAIEEAIAVVSKLTDKQVDMLTVNMLVNHNYLVANSISALKQFLFTICENFKFSVRFNSAEVSHLEFTGAAKGGGSNRHKTLDVVIRTTFPGMFQRSFSEAHFAGMVPDHHLYRELLIPSETEPGLFVLDAISTSEINSFFAKKGWGNENKAKLFNFQNLMGSDIDEVRRKILEMEPRAGFLFSFEHLEVLKLDLSPVGVAIACANFCRKVGSRIAWPYHMRNL